MGVGLGGGGSFKPCEQVVRGGLVSFGLPFGLKIREGGRLPLLSDSPDDVNWQ